MVEQITNFMQSNPFTTTFGKEPTEYISRSVNAANIIQEFSADPSPNQVYMLTGVRGSGKSVLMSRIANYFRKDKDWIVIELSTTWNMLDELASQLDHSELHPDISVSLNLPVVGLEVSNSKSSAEMTSHTRVLKMLDVLVRKGKRLLIAVDEAVNNEYVRQFVSAFQIYLRQNYPVYLIMTGLFENIHNLQNEKNLTFLYRAPSEELGPLNMDAVTERYRSVFDISQDEAREMARITKGYPYAFQVLGSLYWQEREYKTLEQILPDLDDWLGKYVYSKIWSELSGKDQTVLRAMVRTGSTNVTLIRNSINMAPGEFSTYKRRLLRKQIITVTGYGEIAITLPRFDVFVRNWYW